MTPEEKARLRIDVMRMASGRFARECRLNPRAKFDGADQLRNAVNQLPIAAGCGLTTIARTGA